jgi:copper(I)-binding protein
MTLAPFDCRSLARMLALVCSLLAANITFAAKAETAAISVENAWARATPKGAQVAAGYLTIKNDGEDPDRLVSAEAAFAGRTEIHLMRMSDGVMQMRPVSGGVAIPAKGTLKLEPGGYHLMFMELAAPLTEGAAVSGALTFERAGRVPVTFQVLGIGAQGPAEDSHQGH